MVYLSVVNKEGFMAELKEIKEIATFTVDLVCLIVKEVRQHKGKALDIVREILVGIVSEKIRTEGIAAFSGLANIPAEVKAAGIEGWIDFGIVIIANALPALIAAFTDPVAPTV
jgi:hypothetical protein